MNAKTLTVSAAITAVLAGLIYEYGELIALFLGLAVFSYLISWSVTEAYKRLYFSPIAWKQEMVKRKIYRCALYSGWLCMMLCGCIFILSYHRFTTPEKIVIAVFWPMASTLIGGSSPLVWRWTFDKLLPKLNKWVKG